MKLSLTNTKNKTMKTTNNKTMTATTPPTAEPPKNGSPNKAILAGGPPRLAPLQPKTAPSPASGNPRHPQGMSATKGNRKSGPPDGKTESGGENPAGTRPAPAAPRPTAIPAYDTMLATMRPDPNLTAEQYAAELDEATAEAFAAVPDLKPCPFCGMADRLQIMGWSHERPDYTEFEGDAVNCNRCDCVVPLAAWQGRTEVKP